MIPKQPFPAKFFTKNMEIDPGLAVIWFLAVLSVGIGSYWSGNIRHQVYVCEVHSRQMRRRRLSGSSGSAASQAPSRPQGMNIIEEESSLDVSPIWVLSFVVFMTTMLVVLYLFIRYLAYGVGLVVTFVALFLMKTAQPALLYLVPATLIPVVVIARHRGEFHEIWYGLKPATPPPSEEDAEPPAVDQGKEQPKDSRRKSLDSSEGAASTEEPGSSVGKSPAAGSAAQPQRVVSPAIRSPAGAASSVQPPALLGTMFTVGMR